MNKYDCVFEYQVVGVKTIEANTLAEASEQMNALLHDMVGKTHDGLAGIVFNRGRVYPHDPKTIEVERQFLEDVKREGYDVTRKSHKVYD